MRPATLSAVTAAAPAALSNVKPVVEAPKRDAEDAVAAGVEQVDGVAVGAEADPAAAVAADRLARGQPQAARSSSAVAALPSTNSTDSPGATHVTPVSAIAVAMLLELSSTL